MSKGYIQRDLQQRKLRSYGQGQLTPVRGSRQANKVVERVKVLERAVRATFGQPRHRVTARSQAHDMICYTLLQLEIGRV